MLSELDNAYKNCQGIIHVGAHVGQECNFYNTLNKLILFIEPNPKLYKKLLLNIHKYSKQKAIKALVTDKNNEYYSFNIANNNGGSSSIFDLSDRTDPLFPNIKMINKIVLKSQTLDSIIQTNNDSYYDFLVLDVQGAELLVLKGAENFINNRCKYIYTEISTTEIYKNGVLYSDLKEYLGKKNFFPISEPIKPHVNILFVKK